VRQVEVAQPDGSEEVRHSGTLDPHTYVRFTMKIGELAARTGVSERSLRYYEEQGMIAPERTSGGQRRYTQAAVDRVIRIQELYAAGLSSSRIARLLPCMRDADDGPRKIADGELVDELVAERERIDRTMADLARSRAVLDDVIETAAGGQPVRAGSDGSV
jgi:DNA-binding transcriptional MerR regulator